VGAWTKSACAVLAWSILILVIFVAAAGFHPAVRPAQANIGTAGSTTQVTLASMTSAAAPPSASAAAARPAGYVVQAGDTLSGIAARLAVRGGWPALYAANRLLIGPDPGLIRPGTVLVLPGRAALARYVVGAGDTLAGIAAALGVRGGWPALYAANRAVIGPDPALIRPGTVLRVPGPARPAPAAAAGPGSRHLAPRPAPPGGRRHLRPGRTPAPAAAAGLPSWLKTVLLAAALITGAAFLTEPVILAARRRRTVRPARPGPAGTTPRPASAGTASAGTAGVRTAGTRLAGAGTAGVRPAGARTAAATTGSAGAGAGPGSGLLAAGKARIVVADYDRVVVTRCPGDGTVCVLRPPGTAAEVILRAARLVLPEDPCRQLAAQLGMPGWPIILADYHRVVVTRSPGDGTVCVLRPPGTAAEAILRAARLILPEDPYQELASQLGIPAGLPMTT
jgi:LysM repeat protein